MLKPTDKSLKRLKFTVLCLYFVVVPAFESTMAGLSHEVFGDQYRLAGTGAALTFTSGVAGIIGPDAIHSHFNSYPTFFFGSAVLSAVGAVQYAWLYLLSSYLGPHVRQPLTYRIEHRTPLTGEGIICQSVTISTVYTYVHICHFFSQPSY